MNQELVEIGVNFFHLLETLGVKQVTEWGTKCKALCPFHTEKTPSFILTDNGRYYCFGCEASGDLIDLTKHCRQLSFKPAVEWLMQFIGVTGDWMQWAQKIQHVKETQEFMRMVKQVAEPVSLTQLDESLVQRLQTGRREFYLNRGFTDAVLDQFQVGWALDPYKVERLFFPVRDEAGILVGLSGRRLDQEKKMKWIHSDDLPKKKLLFNLQNALRCDILEPMILTEGPVDCMKATMFGYGKVVALLGHSVSKDQRKLLMRHCGKLVLALDQDAAGLKGLGDAIKELYGLFRLYYLPLPEGKDIGDLTKEEFQRAWENQALIRSRTFAPGSVL